MPRHLVCFLALLLSSTPVAADEPRDALHEAQALLDENRFDEAIPILEDLFESQRDRELAEEVALRLLDAYARAGRVESLESLVATLRADPAFLAGKRDLAGLLAVIDRQSQRRRAHTLEKAKDYAACAQVYQELYDDAPRDPAAHELLYNAGVCHEHAGAADAAAGAYRKLARTFPNSALTGPATIRAAELEASSARPAAAAALYETYARNHGGEPEALRALATATRMRLGLGQDARAVADLALFVKRYQTRRKPETAELFFEVATGLGGKKARRKQLEAYLKAFGEHPRDRVVVAHGMLGELAGKNARKARKHFAAAVAAHERLRPEELSAASPEEREARLAAAKTWAETARSRLE